MREFKKKFRVTQGQGCLNYFHGLHVACDYAKEASSYSGLPISVEKWDAVLSEWKTVKAISTN